MNGGAVYCAAVRRWPSRQARQVVYLMRAIYPAFRKERRKERRKFSTRRKFSGCRAEPDQKALACRRYSKDTSCPAVLSPAQGDGNDKTSPVLSRSEKQVSERICGCWVKALRYPFRGSWCWGSRKQRNAPAFRVRPRTICAAGAAPPRRCRRRLTTLLKVTS